MKKLLTIIILSLMWNEFSFAKDDKEFFISCSAKGIYKMSYDQSSSVKTVFDEYKIVIGKGDTIQAANNPDGERWPLSITLVNTNAEIPNNFYLHRKKTNLFINYNDKIISFRGEEKLSKKANAHTETTLSLISGVYKISYRDEIYVNDKSQLSAIGKCEGLVPVLAYLQNKSSSSNYLDYWWAVILIIAITFFIFTQSGKRLKQIRRK